MKTCVISLLLLLSVFLASDIVAQIHSDGSIVLRDNPAIQSSAAEADLNESQAPIIADTTLTNRPFGTIKVDPLQLILSSEIPGSLEFYFSHIVSLNVQAGYIFPAWKGSVRRGLYESYGVNGNAKTKGLFYYRNCPYNNDGGIDLKSELRIYFHPVKSYLSFRRKSGYFALQFMYKHCYYDHLSIYLGSPSSYQQTESKKSDIYGWALILGRQKYINRSLVTDLYGGIGFKNSGINYTILSVPPYRFYHPGQTGYESITSLYLSFGLRFGFKL